MTASKPERIKVYCVDDHALVARGLRAAVQMERDLEWVGSQATADGLVQSFDKHQPDVVLLDVDLPGADVFVELSALVELRPNARILMLTAHMRDQYIETAMTSGARGYVSKSCEFDDLLSAIRRVARGEFAFPEDFDDRFDVEDGRPILRQDRGSGLAALTEREILVLRLIASGSTTKDIADQIHRSVKRVESIRTTIMKKLSCADRLELTRLAIREGLVEP